MAPDVGAGPADSGALDDGGLGDSGGVSDGGVADGGVGDGGGAGDEDGDGYEADTAGGDDCDDHDAEVHPGADDGCGDGVDADCDGVDPECGPWGAVSVRHAELVIRGARAVDYLGASLTLGDADCDGAPDLAIGAYGVDEESSLGAGLNGAVYVVPGADWPSGEIEDLASSVLVSRAGEGTGLSIVMDDLDGDGCDDLGIGTYSFGVPEAEVPMAWMQFGPITGDTVLDSTATQLHAPAAAGFVGWLVATSDHDGDGAAELLVSAPRADLALTDAGAVYLVSASSTSAMALEDGWARLDGSAAAAGAGQGLAGCDLGGDGFDDVIAGELGAGFNPYRSEVRVMDGPIAAGVGSLADSDHTLQARAEDDRFGLQLTCGDVDHDGISDLLVGAALDTGGKTNGGAVYAFFGPLGAHTGVGEAAAQIMGEAGTYAGYAQIAVGDVDGDSFADVALSAAYSHAPEADMATYLVRGPLSGVVDLAEAGGVIYGDEGMTGFGQGLAVGDGDSDGFDDVFIGVYLDHDSYEGGVYGVKGGPASAGR